MKVKYGLVLGAVLGLATTRIALADPTALDLIKKGDAYLGLQSRDKILQIYSEKSVASLTPNIWHVVYYDPDAMFGFVDVKFGAGQEMAVSYPAHPLRPFQLPASAGDILDPSKLRVDSDRALKIAQSQPLLKRLTLRSSKLTLERSDNVPVWKIQLWASKMSDPANEAGIGTVVISADDGSVIKADLHPDSAE